MEPSAGIEPVSLPSTKRVLFHMSFEGVEPVEGVEPTASRLQRGHPTTRV